jgi:hypothetical protein
VEKGLREHTKGDRREGGLKMVCLGIEDIFFGRLQHGIDAAQDAHRQDDIRIFAALEQVAEHLISDAPNEGDDFVVDDLVHFSCFWRIAGLVTE